MQSFACVEDKDIESFLHSRAVEFEKLSKSRTYLVCDKEEMLAGKSQKQLTIYGYISIALKTFFIPDDFSNRARKELDGFSAKIHGEPIRDIPCYLIGQLARNSNVSKDSLSGTKLLGYAYSIIAQAEKAVGGRYIMIECHRNRKLIKFYQENQFYALEKAPDENTPMVQMFRKIEQRN